MVRRLMIAIWLLLPAVVSAQPTLSAPRALNGIVNGATVSLFWDAPAASVPPSGYLVEASFSPGGLPIATLPVAGTSVVVPGVPAGRYVVRVRAVTVIATVSGPSNEIVITVGSVGACTSPPGAPQGLSGQVTGGLLSLVWAAPVGGCAPEAYRIQAGTSAGQSNIAQVDVTDASLSVLAPAGTYFIRVLALNAFGASAASREIVAIVPSDGSGGGACTTSPGRPRNVAAVAQGTVLFMSWDPPLTGCAPTGYAIRGGSFPGGDDLLSSGGNGFTNLSMSVAPGTYYIRIFALNAPYAVSVPSEEVIVVVPGR